MHKIIVPFFVAAAISCAFAQDDELIVVDEFTGRDASEELLDADQSESGNVIAGNESKANSSDVVDADLEGDNIRRMFNSFSREEMHFGGRGRLGVAALFGDFGAKIGTKDDVGFAFNYFFYKKLAFQTGLDFHVLVLCDIDNGGYGGKNLYNYYYSELRYYEVKDYTISFVGVSLPLTLRLGDRFWGEFGFQFDYVTGWTNYTTLPENYYTGHLRDPFRPKSMLYPNVLAGFGVNMPKGNWYLDLGVQITVGLNDIEIDYEQSSEYPVFSIGVIIAFWR